MKNRAQIKGKALDKDCINAYRTTHEFGQSDDRIFCYGLYNKMTDETLDKCVNCKSFVNNATQIEEV